MQREISRAQETMDALLLKAAQVEDSLSAGFMRLAKDKQNEVSLLQQRMERIETGKRENCQEPAKTLELVQELAGQYVTFPPPQKRQIVQSVFLDLRVDTVDLCGEYWLPFSILVENHTRPLKSGRQDLNLRPLAPHASALAKLRHAPQTDLC